LPGDIRHIVQTQGSYQILPWLAFGVAYRYLSGAPYNRFSRDLVYNSFTRLETQRGFDSRGTLDPSDDVPLRLPDIASLDVQLRANFRTLIGHNLEAWVDVLNILASRTTTDVVETDTVFFGQTLQRLPPMRARLAVRYRY
jgi:hypothetical protein